MRPAASWEYWRLIWRAPKKSNETSLGGDRRLPSRVGWSSLSEMPIAGHILLLEWPRVTTMAWCTFETPSFLKGRVSCFQRLFRAER